MFFWGGSKSAKGGPNPRGVQIRYDTGPRAFMKIANHMMDLIYGRWHHLLTRYNHDFLSLSPQKLLQYGQVIEQAEAAFDNCWGFVDGTVRPVCRPGKNQRAIYDGHKRVHSIKFQAVVLPNGLVGNLFGSIEGRRHNRFMLAASGY